MRLIWAGAGTLAVAAVSALVLACGDAERPPAEPAPGGAAGGGTPAAEAPAVSAEVAAEAFATRCASCHGVDGSGNGPAAAGLTPKPRDFRDPEWQDAVSDTHIQQVISYGGAAVGLSPIMPAHPDLAGQPELLAGLVAHVRSLGR